MGRHVRVVVVLLFAAGAAAALQAGPAPGLAGYWPLDESGGPAADLSGNGNDGTWLNGPTASAASVPAGPPGIGVANPACLQFDGVDDAVDMGSPAALDLAGAITVSAWVNLDALNAEQKIVAKWSDTPFSFSWLLTAYTGNVNFWIQPQGGTQAAASLPVALVPGQWAHVVGTYDGQTVAVYVNGGTPATNTLAAPALITMGSATVRVGAGSDADPTMAEPLDGRIDDVRIYDYALTPAEVGTLYDGQPPSTPSLAATPGDAQAALTWSGTGALQWTLRRSTTSGSGYVDVVTQPGTSFVDAGLTNGTTYYYVVVAEGPFGTATSAEASATPAAGAGGGGGSGATSSGREGHEDDECGCGVIGGPTAWPGLFLLAAALLLLTTKLPGGFAVSVRRARATP